MDTGLLANISKETFRHVILNVEEQETHPNTIRIDISPKIAYTQLHAMIPLNSRHQRIFLLVDGYKYLILLNC